MSTERASHEATTAIATTAEAVTIPRTRRALLGGLIGGLGALVASAVGRDVPGANAAAGSNLVLGANNSAGSSQTVLTSSAGGAAFTLKDTAAAGTGIFGWSSATSGAGRGLYGRTDSPDGIAIQARQSAGQAGQGAAIEAIGGQNKGIKASGSPIAIHSVVSGLGAAFQGETADGWGAAGIASGSGTGIRGISADGLGVYGTSTTAAGVSAGSTSGYGVYAISGTNDGVYGTASGIGKYGVRGVGTGFVGSGVIGAAADGGNGVKGTTSSGYAVIAEAASGTGLWASSNLGVAVYGVSYFNWSGYFGIDARVENDFQVGGNASVAGSLSKGGGSFKIDHPLDPSGKYLMHSFVESPDMLNIYNGVAVLDSRGAATVAMPGYFEALNRDFRYQLTALGRPAPDLHVQSELARGRFTIAGGAANQRVSWQVTGVRRDAWANANRIPVEVTKSGAERGTYLHPEVHGQPASKRAPAKYPTPEAPAAATT